MQDAAFIEAAEPRPHRVLGLELLPFTIGHFLLLQRHGSVFVAQGGGHIGIDDLLLAALICSQTYEEAKGALRSRWLPLFTKFWGWRSRKANIFAEVAAMKDYMAALENTPDIVVDLTADGQARGGSSGTPWINKLKVFLMADLHVSHAEAMDYPIVEAQWDFWTLQALRGNDQMVSESLEEAFRLAREESNGA